MLFPRLCPFDEEVFGSHLLTLKCFLLSGLRIVIFQKVTSISSTRNTCEFGAALISVIVTEIDLTDNVFTAAEDRSTLHVLFA